ncbi:MAG TPA: helix-turn-helix domain-containing protein [Candidatus Binatia bacterium]|nr:helix-turn-helix domain-containing protein [Candidatus Binatia bacterium]
MRRPVRVKGARPARGTPAGTRARLVAAAADVLNRHGYHRTDSNKIARAAGYAPGTFYKHFADKRAILLAAYEEWVSAEWRAVEDEIQAGGSATAVAARIVDLVLSLHRRWRGLRSSLLSLVATDPVVRRFYREQRRRQLRMLSRRRAVTHGPPRSAEEDAVLLFTLERTCDAIANGEARDLGLNPAATVTLLHDLVSSHIARR